MTIEKLEQSFTVCKVPSLQDIPQSSGLYFIAHTDKEISLVCETKDTPAHTTECDPGWKGFRVQGTLDFSLIGILSELSTLLAREKIGIFAVSTYDTDYILVKEENFQRALAALEKAGHTLA